MTRTGLDTCSRCGAVLGPWEKACGCEGPRPRTIREVLYRIACTATQALHARDYVRIAEHDHGVPFSMNTAFVTLSGDYRFCWAGAGLYGLYRHGPLPGPRGLEPATRLLLVTADRPLGHDVVDFCLKRFGYRYNVASLRNAVARSENIVWLDGFWDHHRGDDAEWDLLHDIAILPEGQWDVWGPLRSRIGADVAKGAAELRTRLTTLAEPNRFGLDWSSG